MFVGVVVSISKKSFICGPKRALTTSNMSITVIMLIISSTAIYGLLWGLFWGLFWGLVLSLLSLLSLFATTKARFEISPRIVTEMINTTIKTTIPTELSANSFTTARIGCSIYVVNSFVTVSIIFVSYT